MSIMIGGPISSVQTNVDTGFALKTAHLAKNQQEMEGQMALQMIQAASVDSLALPVGNIGNNVNIKV
jgi:hypothetical protein